MSTNRIVQLMAALLVVAFLFVLLTIARIQANEKKIQRFLNKQYYLEWEMKRDRMKVKPKNTVWRC